MAYKARPLNEVLADLPEFAAAYSMNNEPVILKRGKTGHYWSMPVGWTVATWNRHHNVTPAQAQAMLNGSLFGFHVPMADPKNPFVIKLAALRQPMH
jgi:hypothetical protein